ncbi:MAG: DUF973 family protein, partial [Conexivisphaerales archaeon]
MSDVDKEKVCAKCGARNRPSAKFCTSCGAPLTELPSRCPKCGKPAPAGASFCGYCGAPLSPPVGKSENESETKKGETKICESCGTQIPIDAEACPNCGHKSSPQSAPEALPQFSGQSAVIPYKIEKGILRKIKTFSIVGLFGILLLSAFPVYDLYDGYPLSISSLADLHSTLWNVLLFAIIGLIVCVAALIELRSAFSALSNYSQGFSRPAVMIVIMIAGVSVILFYLGVIFAEFNAYSGTSFGNGLPAISFFQLVVYGLILSVAAGLFLLIGFIGLTLGLWRIGRRYGMSTIKAASLSYVILIISGLIAWGYITVFYSNSNLRLFLMLLLYTTLFSVVIS